MAAERIGIVGVPPLAVIRELQAGKYRIIDLDEPQVHMAIDLSAQFLPKVYCAVLRTVVLNAMYLDLDRLYIDVGPGKCDCALHVATILEEILDIPVIRTRNLDDRPFGVNICRTRMPLFDKFMAITRGIQADQSSAPLPPCTPTAGFWGVPPRDFSILTLFPDTTHIYGWTRCMENKTPANLGLEMHVNPSVPTVFFAQSFCAKTALAHHLSRLHPRALYLDCDVTAGNSARAKIEAFLELSGVGDNTGMA
ncbi:MAG TPA: hypothetical protein ENN06_10320 [Desulfobacteraceae bacterium]|nr:hypothetical protein [Desulfobacteraceae bacterium]